MSPRLVVLLTHFTSARYAVKYSRFQVITNKRSNFSVRYCYHPPVCHTSTYRDLETDFVLWLAKTSISILQRLSWFFWSPIWICSHFVNSSHFLTPSHTWHKVLGKPCSPIPVPLQKQLCSLLDTGHGAEAPLHSHFSQAAQDTQAAVVLLKGMRSCLPGCL